MNALAGLRLNTVCVRCGQLVSAFDLTEGEPLKEGVLWSYVTQKEHEQRCPGLDATAPDLG